MTVYSPDLRDRRHHGARAYPDLRDWLNALEIEGKADRTREAYEQTVAFLLRAHPEKTVEEFTPGVLLQLLKDFPPKARHIRRSQLNAFTSWLRLQRRIGENPMEFVPRIMTPRRKVAATFTDAEQALLEGLPGRDGALMSTLFRTGVRIGEAQRMQVKHVQFDRDRIVIPKGKGGKGRIIPIRQLAGTLADWFLVDGLQPDWFLWPTHDAGRVHNHTRMPSKGAMYGWWRDCLLAAGVDASDGDGRRTFHSTRHTFATTYLRRGGKLERLSLILGHESIKTTMDVYVHLDFDDAYADLELIEG